MTCSHYSRHYNITLILNGAQHKLSKLRNVSSSVSNIYVTWLAVAVSGFGANDEMMHCVNSPLVSDLLQQ